MNKFLLVVSSLLLATRPACSVDRGRAERDAHLREAGYEVAQAELMCNASDDRLIPFRAYVAKESAADRTLQRPFLEGWRQAESDFNASKKERTSSSSKARSCVKMFARIDKQAAGIVSQ